MKTSSQNNFACTKLGINSFETKENNFNFTFSELYQNMWCELV